MGGVFTPLNLNVYAYTHQDPLRYVDPDGREITVKRHLDKSGVWRTDIKFTAVLTNASSAKLSQKDMASYARRIEQAIERDYSKTLAKGKEVVTAHADIEVGTKATGGQHTISLVDQIAGSKDVLGMAPFGKKDILVNVGLVTGAVSGGGASLERTSAHEFGHSANLRHPNDPANALKLLTDNLMSQTQYSSSEKVQFNQVMEMYKASSSGLLNQP